MILDGIWDFKPAIKNDRRIPIRLQQFLVKIHKSLDPFKDILVSGIEDMAATSMEQTAIHFFTPDKATRLIFLLEYSHMAPVLDPLRRRQTRNACANHRDVPPLHTSSKYFKKVRARTDV